MMGNGFVLEVEFIASNGKEFYQPNFRLKLET